MTYATEKVRPGRQPFTIVEVDLDKCQNEYATAPCMAALGVTGTRKCYKTIPTCQDPANYNRGTKTYKFCSPAADIPLALGAIPSVRGHSIAPTKLDPGGSLGQRASVSVTFQDHAHHDRGVDDYWAERAAENSGVSRLLIDGGGSRLLIAPGSYLLLDEAGEDQSSELRGTFWGRARARNQHYLGRALRIKTGYLTDPVLDTGSPESEQNFITRTYVQESWSGPDSSGKFTITAKDPLKLADDERAQCPAPSGGALLADITAGDLALTLNPSGVGDDEYSASGLAQIGREVVQFTRVGDTLTLTRAQYGTAAAAHSAGDVVQVCKLFSADQVHNHVYDLLVNFAGVPGSYIPKAEWDAEAAAYLTQTYSTIITQPTGVNALLSELIQQAPFYLWYNEREARIELRALRAPDANTLTLTEDAHLIADSVSVSDRPQERLSQVWVYSNQVDPTESLTKTSNYSRLYVAADPDAESPNKFGQAAIKRIFSRWILTQGTAADLADQLLQAYSRIPRTITFSLDAKNSDLVTGDQVNISTRLVQDVDGSNEVQAVQILEMKEAQTAHRFSYVAQARAYTVTTGRYQLIYSVDQYPVNFRDDFVALYGADDLAPAVDIIILANVILGSVRVGDWPDDADLLLTVLGRSQGSGGRGGAGAWWDSGIDKIPLTSTGFRAARAGGTAFYTRFPISIDNQGEIWGGAGGGSGGDASVFGEIGGSGGGGAGQPPGAGNPGFPTSGSNPGDSGTTEAGGDGGAGINGGGAGSSGGSPGNNGDGSFGAAAGKAIDGNAFITWIATGDIRGDIS